MASPNPSPSSSSSSPPQQTLASPAAAPPHDPDPTPPSPPASDPPSQPASDQGGKEGEEEEEEGECGFCLFMKGGGCKDAFVAWEQCVEAAEKSGDNIVDRCFEVTSQLKKCMDAHSDYYEPILRAEEALADSIEAEKGSPAAAASEEEGKGKTEESSQ